MLTLCWGFGLGDGAAGDGPSLDGAGDTLRAISNRMSLFSRASCNARVSQLVRRSA
jgi:hypothetical protein